MCRSPPGSPSTHVLAKVVNLYGKRNTDFYLIPLPKWLNVSFNIGHEKLTPKQKHLKKIHMNLKLLMYSSL